MVMLSDVHFHEHFQEVENYENFIIFHQINLLILYSYCIFNLHNYVKNYVVLLSFSYYNIIQLSSKMHYKH